MTTPHPPQPSPSSSVVQVVGLPAFDDNYLWVIHNSEVAVVVDPGDEEPVLAFLRENRLRLVGVLCTHHHPDHVGGVEALLASAAPQGVPVWGPGTERIPARTHTANEDTPIHFSALELTLQVLAVPGHTAGHVAYHAAAFDWLFCGDTLFACGCGRLFEGTAAQMQASLAALAALPPETLVFCAHEYTLSNLRFALAVEPNNTALLERSGRESARRANGQATVPFTLAEEQSCNPFLRWHAPAVRAAAASFLQQPLDDSTPADIIFGAIRAWKNTF